MLGNKAKNKNKNSSKKQQPKHCIAPQVNQTTDRDPQRNSTAANQGTEPHPQSN